MNIKLFIFGTIALTGLTLILSTCFLQKINQTNPSFAEEVFSSFRSIYGKQYSSGKELQYRLSVFVKNLNRIELHNSDITQTYKLGINRFSDLTFEEFKAKYLSNQDEINSIARCELKDHQNDNIKEEKEVNWVIRGVVHEVKDQSTCGSGWAFASTSALESAYAIFSGIKNLDLSEQELVDCTKSYGNHGCSGGLMHLSYNYVFNDGIHETVNYPYNSAANQKCQASTSEGPVHKIIGCKKIERGVDNLMSSTSRQPVTAVLFVAEDFMSYKEGVYNPTICKGAVNHAITIVGYNLKTEIPYFLIKNSWGTSWGQKGYIQLAIGNGKGTCNIAGHDWNYYPVVKN